MWLVSWHREQNQMKAKGAFHCFITQHRCSLSVKNKEQHVEFHLKPKIKPWMFCHASQKNLRLFLAALSRYCHLFETIFASGRTSHLIMEDLHRCLADQTALKENQTSTGNHYLVITSSLGFFIIFFKQIKITASHCTHFISSQ